MAASDEWILSLWGRRRDPFAFAVYMTYAGANQVPPIVHKIVGGRHVNGQHEVRVPCLGWQRTGYLSAAWTAHAAKFARPCRRCFAAELAKAGR